MKKILLVLGFALMAVACCPSCTTIDAGSVGVRFKKWSANVEQHGGVMGTCKGWVWFNPFTEDIYEYPIFIQRKSYADITVNTKDAAIFKISPTIAYCLQQDKAEHIFLKYRKTIDVIEDGYMHTAIYEAFRTVSNLYTSDALMANRGKFEAEVRERLDKSLMAEGFMVEEFTAQITPPASLTKAIDAKNEAVQESLKAENLVKQAEANAKISIAKAEGEAKALRIKGDGEAYYNKVVAASLTPLLVQQGAIYRWDGKLSTYSGGGAVPFLNIK